MSRTRVLPQTGHASVLRRENVLDLRDAVAYHQLVLNAEGARVTTQRNYLHYEQILLNALEALGIPPTLESLTPSNVRLTLEWYRSNVRDMGRGGKTAIQQYVLRIKTFARFLENEEILPDNTLRRLTPPRVEKVLRQPFSQAEVSAMWGACRLSRNAARDEALLLLLLDTGMRIGEAASLTLDKLHLDERRAIIGESGKGRRERIVPLGDGAKRDGGRMIRALKTYLSERPDSHALEVFVSSDGYGLSSDAASMAIQRLGKDAGVDHPIPHRLRHTYCTWYMVTWPGDELGLRRIVGHVSKGVLADYVHYSQSIIADRSGRASLAEAWLGSNTARSPAAAPARTPILATVGAPASNDKPQHAVLHPSTSLETPTSDSYFNVQRIPRKAERYLRGI